VSEGSGGMTREGSGPGGASDHVRRVADLSSSDQPLTKRRQCHSDVAAASAWSRGICAVFEPCGLVDCGPAATPRDLDAADMRASRRGRTYYPAD
jgi:hypothetical protein